MNETITQKRLAVLPVILIAFLTLTGCKKTDNAKTQISSLKGQIPALQVIDSEGNVKEVTLSEAEHWHETGEHHHEEAGTSAEEEHHSSHQCLGTLVGYQAIRYATEKLFADETPQSSDFTITVTGPMEGVWDVMGLYMGKEMLFTGEAEPLTIKSFTFEAKRESTNESLVFQLKESLIPQKFLDLKNEGATCGNAELGKFKQQAILNILSTELETCFQVIDASETT